MKDPSGSCNIPNKADSRGRKIQKENTKDSTAATKAIAKRVDQGCSPKGLVGGVSNETQVAGVRCCDSIGDRCVETPI